MLKAIIIDDELLCRKAILEKIAHHPTLEIVGQAKNVQEGAALVKQLSPDILFLDVEMPDGTGFNLLEQFPSRNFQVIFTTGHNDYAIKAFKHSAIDYLLKPVEKEDLNSAINRAILQLNQTYNSQKIAFMLNSLENNNFSKLAIPVIDGIEFLSKNEILYCEADGSYSHIHLFNGSIITTTYNLKKISDLLGEKSFYRVHKSYIIALEAIDKILHSEGGSVVLNNQKTIPIARRRKEDFLKLLGL